MQYQPKSERSRESTKHYLFKEAKGHVHCASLDKWVTIEEAIKAGFTPDDKPEPELFRAAKNDENLKSFLSSIYHTFQPFVGSPNNRSLRRTLNIEIEVAGALAYDAKQRWVQMVGCNHNEEPTEGFDKSDREYIHSVWVQYTQAAFRSRVLRGLYSILSREAGAFREVKRSLKNAMTAGPTDTLNGTIERTNPDNNGE